MWYHGDSECFTFHLLLSPVQCGVAEGVMFIPRIIGQKLINITSCSQSALQTVFFSLQPSLSPAKTQQAALLDRPPFSWDGSLSLSLSQQYLLSAATFCQRAQLTVSPPAAAPCLPQAVYRCHSCLILNYSAGN